MGEKRFRITNIKKLKLLANTIRQDVIRMLLEAKSGHSAGSIGLADIFTALYFNVLYHDPKEPEWVERDRFVLSNGHVCPVLYAAMANAEYFPKEELLTLRKIGSRLQGHPHRTALPGIENFRANRMTGRQPFYHHLFPGLFDVGQFYRHRRFVWFTGGIRLSKLQI